MKKLQAIVDKQGDLSYKVTVTEVDTGKKTEVFVFDKSEDDAARQVLEKYQHDE